MSPGDRILIGHDGPADASAFDATIAYLKEASRLHAASPDAASHAQGLKAAFPGRKQAGWADFSARLLYAGGKR